MFRLILGIFGKTRLTLGNDKTVNSYFCCFGVEIRCKAICLDFGFESLFEPRKCHREATKNTDSIFDFFHGFRVRMLPNKNIFASVIKV